MSAEIRRAAVAAVASLLYKRRQPEVPETPLSAPCWKSAPNLFLRKTHAIASVKRAMAFLFYTYKKFTAGGRCLPLTGSVNGCSPAGSDFAGAEAMPLTGSANYAPALFLRGGGYTRGFYSTGSDARSDCAPRLIYGGHGCPYSTGSDGSSRPPIENKRGGYGFLPLTGSVINLSAPLFNHIKGETPIMSRIHTILLCAFPMLYISSALYASSLSTNFADVFIDNLKIGGSYNLTQTASYPMWVSWKGDSKVRIKIEPVYPRQDDLKTGYEVVPDVSWVKLSQDEFELLPDETKETDVTISIPDDKKYLGKKYQCYLHITAFPPEDERRASGGMAFALAVKGKVLFGIAPAPPTQEELRELRRKKLKASQGVIISPEKFEIDRGDYENTAADKIFEITGDIPLKIINSSAEKVRITIEAVEPDISGITLPRNYTKGNTSEILFNKNNFYLKPDSIENLRIWLKATKNLPPLQKIFYAVRINIKSPTIEVVKFVRIYLTDKGGENK